MRYPISSIPKIKLNYDEDDKAKIATFILVYLCPAFTINLINFRNKYIFICIACIYYVASFILAEHVIYKERIKNLRYFKKRTKTYIELIIYSITQCFVLQVVLTMLSSKFAQGVSENQKSVSEYPLLLLLLLTLVYSPVVEEVAFRYALRRLITHEVLYIIVSGSIFGIVHTLSSLNSHSFLEIIAYFLPHFGFGIYLAFIYATTNSIETCIITHRGVNLLATIPFLLIRLYH